ncbi:MAG: S-layer homology domain-containing protein, partial [Clostridia bacterium]|nr:S-layer homology domain-containing protein [Clostridia bacterium]
RYADTKAQKTNYKADLDAFADKDSISDWAADGVNYAVATGLFKGNEKCEFAPQGKASRAELATVLQRVNVRTESRIVCWGDSLTMGIQTGFADIAEYPYPQRLGSYLGVETVNYGIGGETSDMIAMRQGALAVYVNNITIPVECEPVLLNYSIDNDDEFSVFALYGFEGINDCEIAGVKGRITAFSREDNRFNEQIYFVRNEPGEQVVITEPERIITYAMTDKKEDDILVIWSGSNDLLGAMDTSRLDTIMGYIDDMIEYAGTDEYVVIGYTANDYLGSKFYTECVDDCNKILAEKYGDKFVNVKSYLATYDALYDNGIEPTERDMERLEKGWIPYSLLDESSFPVHFNQIGYDIVADMVAEKIIELGYLSN